MASTLELTVQRPVDGVWPVVTEHHRSEQLLPVRSEGELRLTGEPVASRPQAYGEALGRSLFTGAIRDAYVAARGDPPVRVWLCIEDPPLRTWRWEWLCAPVDGSRWDFLSLDQRALYSLYLPSLTDRPYPPIGRRDLRALVLVANPADPGGRFGLAVFDAAAAVNRLRAIFEGRATCDVLSRVADAVGPPTLDALITQVTAGASTGAYSILHIVCHGRFDRDAEETWIYLEPPTTDSSGLAPAQPVSATTLIERLARVGQLPHLVFLSVCESSAPEAEQRLGGLAQRLVRELGVPAVIGMTEPVSVPTAQALSDAFYRRLLQQRTGAVDRALVEAYAGLASRLDAHVPALYSRLGGQPLFSLAVDRELTSIEIRAALDQLEALLAERAPVLLPLLAKHRQALEPCLETAPLPASGDAQLTRKGSLKAITEICQEVLDISFHALVLGEPVPAYDARQPFRGLSPFRAEDREFFFGREVLVDTLMRKLAEDPFLPVLGPSGSGKSSVVVAGLVPRLRQHESNLQVAYLTPGSTPLEQLHAVQATLEEGPVLYVVDQFEEVFTTCRSDTQRRDFIERLLSLTPRARVVVTMRADFWGECAPYPVLKTRMQARQELIAPMNATELRAAMEQQAAKVGVRFEADLSHTMLDEVAGEPGAMPLLQHALLELWKRRHGRWLRAAEYRTIGGVKRAIAETADQLYAELPAPEQDRMRDIFLRLTQLDEQVTPGAERRDTRRRAPLTDLVPAESDPLVTKTLVKRLADAVLVTTSRNPVTDEDEVEVAHEALIRHWTRLRLWVSQLQSMLQVRQTVSMSTADWQRHGRQEGYLTHRGRRLEDAQELLLQREAGLSETEELYVKACMALRERERANAAEQRLKNLAEVGWGAIFARDADPAIREALQPLLAARKEQSTRLRDSHYHDFSGDLGYHPGETKRGFLARHGAGSGPPNPTAVPYYLLIVGDPETIPFSFQYQLDVQHAVGRICFESVEEYANYARSVLAAERGRLSIPRRMVLFGAPAHPHDHAMKLGRQHLIAPLAETLANQQPDWAIDTVIGQAATRTKLASVLECAEAPAILFTTTHGTSFPPGHDLQRSAQGAVVCQEYQGFGPLSPADYFSGQDVSDDVSLLGRIVFLWSCYSGGTPRLDDFESSRGGVGNRTIAPRAFVAALPQRLLGHPAGGALAVIGRVERAWSYSFLEQDESVQDGIRNIGAFVNSITRLMHDFPVGAAVEFFNQRYVELASELVAEIDNSRDDDAANQSLVQRIRIAVNDARNYIVLGDPAVRLNVSSGI